jgi:hypothetical protein
MVKNALGAVNQDGHKINCIWNHFWLTSAIKYDSFLEIFQMFSDNRTRRAGDRYPAAGID